MQYIVYIGCPKLQAWRGHQTTTSTAGNLQRCSLLQVTYL